MKFFSKIKDNPLSSFLIVLLLLAFGAFVGVLVSEWAEKHISKLLGLSEKNEVLKFLGISMGGILIALQALMSYRRAKAMEDAVEKTEQGQRQERLKNAIEHLGHESDSVRLGGAYELFHLAKDTLGEDLKEKLSQTVLDILCAHIRRTTSKSEYREAYLSKPSEEIQSLLTLLFVQKHEVFRGCRTNLQGSWLNGANLRDARLEKAILTKARLRGANLSRARLQGADLTSAGLQGTKLIRARLQKAILTGERRGADVTAVRSGVDPTGARLQGADLSWAWMQGANLNWTEFQEADLTGVRLQGVTSTITREEPSLSFEERIRGQIREAADLTRVIFAGGLNQEELNDLLEGFSDEEAKELRKNLTPHIDEQASHKPEDIRVITTAYTKEKAEQWIAEYNEATKDIED